MEAFISFNEKTYKINYSLLKRKIPKFKFLKDPKIIKDEKELLKNKDILYIYLFNPIKKKNYLFLEYSKNKTVAKKIINYFEIEEKLEVWKLYEHFTNNESSTLSSGFKKIIPTSVQETKDFLEFAKEYEVEEIKLLIEAKNAKFVQNLF